MDHRVVTLQTHHACPYLVSVHQTAPPLSSDSSHLIAAYYSFIDPRRIKSLYRASRGFSSIAELPCCILYSHFLRKLANNLQQINTHGDCVGRRRLDFRVRLSVCLFVRSITQKRMILKYSNLVYREWPWDILRVTWFWVERFSTLGLGLTAIRRGLELYECLQVLRWRTLRVFAQVTRASTARALLLDPMLWTLSECWAV